MLFQYFEWQFFLAPRFLLGVIGNIQRALIQVFSVPVMIRTLFAHWHKDVVAYQAGTVSGLLLAFSWNQISRAIGFVVRSLLLLIWLGSAITLLIFTSGLLLIVLAWPFLIIASLWTGLILLTA